MINRKILRTGLSEIKSSPEKRQELAFLNGELKNASAVLVCIR